jgi:hypothetical protein
LSAVEKLKLRVPDSTHLSIADGTGVADAVYKSSRALVFLAPPTAELVSYASDRGFTTITFAADPNTWSDTFVAHPEVFGTPTTA